jgi:hypothetical protein
LSSLICRHCSVIPLLCPHCSVIPSEAEGPAFCGGQFGVRLVRPTIQTNTRSFDFEKGLASESLLSAQDDNVEKLFKSDAEELL